MRFAKCGSKSPFECRHPWPADVGIQCGTNGLVLTSPGALAAAMSDPEVAAVVAVGALTSTSSPDSYIIPAFFEAFPTEPSCFLRGEGETLADAEEQCWLEYQKIMACGAHEFERRGRRDGYGFCKKCGMGSMFAEPLDTCSVCGKPTNYITDSRGVFFCEEHITDIPLEFRNRIVEMMLDIKP